MTKLFSRAATPGQVCHLHLKVHRDAAEVVESDFTDGDGFVVSQTPPEVELGVRIVSSSVAGVAAEGHPDVRLRDLPLPIRRLETRLDASVREKKHFV